MPDETTIPNTPGNVATTEGTGTAVVPASQTQEPQNPGNTPSSGLTEAEVVERLEKARADEKQKVFGKIETLSKEKEELAQRYAKTEADLKAAQADRDKLREGKSSEVDSIQKELQEMRMKNEKLESAIENVATEAAEQIERLEVKAYRERVIREQNVELSELVSGKTTEEVDESVKKAIEREAQLKAKFAGAATTPPADPTVQSGQTTPQEEQAPAAAPSAVPPVDTSGLPRPINPDGSQGRDPLVELNPLNREALSKLPRAEYLKKRDELLAAAKRKSGLL
jgi:hypothetical protein